jgi:hypothetical protein
VLGSYLPKETSYRSIFFYLIKDNVRLRCPREKNALAYFTEK